MATDEGLLEVEIAEFVSAEVGVGVGVGVDGTGGIGVGDGDADGGEEISELAELESEDAGPKGKLCEYFCNNG